MNTALAIHEGTALVPHQPRLGLLRPLAQPAEIIQSQEETRTLIEQALKPGRDYGNIPGVDKPSLLKPGAERITLAFGCTPRFRIVEQEVDHNRPVPWRKVKAIWEGQKGNRRKAGETVETGESLGLYRYVVECEIVHRESGQVVGTCVGSCSTMESKYIDRPRDCENTVVKMAQKRAYVGAALTAFGLSEQFTQDVEDLPREVLGTAAASDDDAVKCPKCSGAMWDNREKNDEREKAGQRRMPDYKCKKQECEAVIWDAAKYAADLAASEGEQRPDPTTQSASTDRSGSLGSVASGLPTTNAGEMTLEQAKLLPLMGRPDSWGNFGTKPLKDVPDKVLKQARHFFNDKVRESANPRMEEQLTAIALVMDDREANSPQETLPLAGKPVAETPAPAAAAAPQDAGPAVRRPAHEAKPDASVAWIDEQRKKLQELLADPQLTPKVKADVEAQLSRGEVATLAAIEAAIATVERGILPF